MPDHRLHFGDPHPYRERFFLVHGSLLRCHVPGLRAARSCSAVFYDQRHPVPEKGRAGSEKDGFAKGPSSDRALFFLVCHLSAGEARRGAGQYRRRSAGPLDPGALSSLVPAGHGDVHTGAAAGPQCAPRKEAGPGVSAAADFGLSSPLHHRRLLFQPGQQAVSADKGVLQGLFPLCGLCDLGSLAGRPSHAQDAALDRAAGVAFGVGVGRRGEHRILHDEGLCGWDAV